MKNLFNSIGKMRLENLFISRYTPDNGPIMARQWSDNGPMKIHKIAATMALLFIVGAGPMWGDETLLFQETFGVGDGDGARTWDMDYADQSGVSAVYGDATYTVTSAKQTKNSTNASLNTVANNTEATFVAGPLDVSDYESLKVVYDWQAGTTANKTYYTKLYYKTAADGSYTEITKASGTNTTTFSAQTFSSIPAAAEVSTLYLKVAWKSENVSSMIDNFKLYGTEGCAYKITLNTPTKTGTGTITFDETSPVKTCDGETTVTATATPGKGYYCSSLSFSGGSVEVSPNPSTTKPAYPSAQEYTLTFAQNTNATLTSSVTFTAYTDKFQDYMHGNSISNKNGNYNTMPAAPSDATPGDDYCAEKHYHFVGWVLESSINNDGTLKDDAVVVPAAESGHYATGVTWVAVWAQE